MRADHRALAALDAAGDVPHRDLLGEVALLELRRAGGKRAVARHGRDGNAVAAAGDDLEEDVVDESRRPRARGDVVAEEILRFAQDDTTQVLDRGVDRVQVLVDDLLSLALERLP